MGVSFPGLEELIAGVRSSALFLGVMKLEGRRDMPAGPEENRL
jgi:hypothetical protein